MPKPRLVTVADKEVCITHTITLRDLVTNLIYGDMASPGVEIPEILEAIALDNDSWDDPEDKMKTRLDLESAALRECAEKLRKIAQMDDGSDDPIEVVYPSGGNLSDDE